MENSTHVPEAEITLKPPKSHGLVDDGDFIDPKVGDAWSQRWLYPEASKLILEHLLAMIRPPGFKELFKP